MCDKNLKEFIKKSCSNAESDGSQHIFYEV